MFDGLTPGEYAFEEESATDILVNPITEPTVVNSPIVENLDINLPFIAATTTVNAPTLDSNSSRIYQAPVEVAVLPDSASARIYQAPVEVAILQFANVRTTQVPTEVAVADDAPQINTTQVVAEVAVADSAPQINTTQIPVEVLIGTGLITTQVVSEAVVQATDANVRETQVVTEAVVQPDATNVVETQVVVEVVVQIVNDLFLTWDAATATVAFVLPTISFTYPTTPAQANVEVVPPGGTNTVSVSAAEASVAAVAPTLSLTLNVATAIADAPTGGETGLSHTYSVALATASAEMPDVGFAILTQETFTVDTAEATVEMPDVGYSETPIPVVVVGGMGAEPMPIDLIGLLTLKVNPAHWHVSLTAPSLKFYRSPEDRRAKKWRRIFKPEKPYQFSMQATPNITLKVVPQNHLVLRVRDQQDFFNFAVESTPVYFEERTSALWGDLRRRSYLDEAKDLLSLHPGRSRISPSNRLRVKPPRGG